MCGGIKIKNPYKLIEKANDTFNLYLNNHDDFENFMKNSNNNQKEINGLFNSFLKEYSDHQRKLDNINQKFLDFFEILTTVVSENNKSIENLQLQLDHLSKDIATKSESNLNVMNQNLDDIKTVMDSNFSDMDNVVSNNTNLINSESKKQLDEIKTLKDSLSEGFVDSRDLINLEFEKQLDEIKTLKDSLSEGFVDSRDLINLEFEKQLDEIKTLENSISVGFMGSNDLIISESQDQKDGINNIISKQDDFQENILQNQKDGINNIISKQDDFQENILQNQKDGINNIISKQDDFQEIYLQDQNTIKSFIDSQVDINKNLNNAVNLFVLNYDECKRCFFNDEEKILKKYLDTDELFRICYFNNIQFLSYSPHENRILLKTKEGIILGTNNRFYTIKEVIGFDGYSVPQLYEFDDFVVFDVGMNRAYASLRFAEFDNCSRVFGFEIDEDTYNKAVYNINLNPDLSKKIKPYNIGLSDKDEEVELYYLEGADGVNTVEHDLVDIQYDFKKSTDEVKTKVVKVKKTTDVINEIMENENISSKIVLKIDVEGSEYKIIDDLIESDLIYKMDLIIGEGHKFIDRNLSDDLLNCGFKKIEFKEKKVVYNFAFVKEEYYDVWPLKK